MILWLWGQIPLKLHPLSFIISSCLLWKTVLLQSLGILRGEKGDFEAWFCPVLEAQKTDWLEIRKCAEKQDSKQHMHDTFLALSPWVLTFFFYYWLALSCKTYQHAISWHWVDTRWQGGFCKCYSVAYRTLLASTTLYKASQCTKNH